MTDTDGNGSSQGKRGRKDEPISDLKQAEPAAKASGPRPHAAPASAPAPPLHATTEESPWVVVAIDDDAVILEQIKDYLEDEDVTIAGRRVVIETSNDFAPAMALLQQRKVDAAIFDVFEGTPENGDSAGLKVLTEWQRIGFAPVILYTALPEHPGVQRSLGTFIRTVQKDAGVKALKAALEDLFSTRIPEVHRALRRHIDSALSAHMWGFVSSSWTAHLAPLKDQSDVVHLLVQRLAAQLTRRGVGRVVEEIYGAGHGDPADGSVRATEFYVKPPLGEDPQLGDLRRLQIDDKRTALVAVLWPSCDMVTDRCKVERVLCAELLPLNQERELKAWADKPDDRGARAKVERMLKNRREKAQEERYHYLPAAWDIPDSLVDFLALHPVSMEELRGAECVATLASPFAESLSARFVRYVSRLGTPDLDYADVLQRLRNGMADRAQGEDA